MTANARSAQPILRRLPRRVFACACVFALLVLAGCKTDKEAKGAGVSRGKDPLVHGPNLIPKQNVPIPDRATGPKGKPDPLVTPTGGRAGYTDEERFKGPVVPGASTTPAALAGRLKDGDELKIDDAGVPLKLAGGALPGGALEAPANVEPLYAQLERLGVKREDRSLEREGSQWVFRASVPRTAEGAKTQYTGIGPTAADAVKQVLTQLGSGQK